MAMAETGDCTKGTGVSHNNCFGVKDFYTGEFVRFDSKEHSYRNFKWNWKKNYGERFPTREDAQRWTGGDRVDNWLRIVEFYYS